MSVTIDFMPNGAVAVMRVNPGTGLPERGTFEPHDQRSLDNFAPDLTQQQRAQVASVWAAVPVPADNSVPGPTPEEDMDMALRTCPACAALIEALLAPVNDPDGIKPGQTLTRTELIRRLTAKRP